MKLMSLLGAAVLALALAFPAFAAGPVDINTASAQEIADGLHGIGLSKAEAIVAYRDAHGPFASADELVNVKGVGDKTVERNREVIVVGGKAAKPGKAKVASTE